jgi:3-hydroxyisobutyrate dehydrogenase
MTWARFASTGGDKTIGFVGLGAMGYPMAGHMARLPGYQCLVWNRTSVEAERHSSEFGSHAVPDLSVMGAADVVVMCLPTSTEDAMIAEQLGPHMARNTCLISCTSGEPYASKRLAEKVWENHRVRFLDCAVSGGPRGAAAASLTCMFGSEDAAATERAMPILQSFSKKVVNCGPAGAGHAVKAVNNALNCAHLLLGAEGLLALQKLGVDPEVALSAINGSSGRSLQTEVRLPEEVLTRRFGYGFKISLMAKDCRAAQGVLKEGFPEAQLLTAAAKVVQDATSEELEDADYTRIVRHLERKAGMELQPFGEKSKGR